jgi:spermidine/putrescine transport system permease protein
MKSKAAAYPYIVWMIIFIVVPTVLVVVFAFTDKSGAFTLDNLKGVGQYSNVFLRSIWLGALATVISLVLGYPLAYIIARKNPSSQNVFIMLVMLPMWMNFLLRTYAWMSLLEDSGIINRALGAVGLGPVPYDKHRRRRGARHGIQLHTLYDTAALFGADQNRPQRHRGGAGSRRE